MSCHKQISDVVSFRKKSIIYENNDSYTQRLVIVLRQHIECSFSLKFSFMLSLPFFPLFISNHPEAVNCSTFLFVSNFAGDFEREFVL